MEHIHISAADFLKVTLYMIVAGVMLRGLAAHLGASENPTMKAAGNALSTIY
jgi:hypothetical protein